MPMSRNWCRAGLRRMTPLVVVAAVCLALLAAASPAAGAAVGPSSTMPVAPPRVDDIGGSQGTGETTTTSGEAGGGGSSGTTGQGMTEGWTQVVTGGFTDPNNSYAPSWAKFQDYLYIGTMANEAGSMFSGSDKSGSDIWRTADGVVWKQIGSAGLGDPGNQLFQLVVFRDRLYAISNNFDHGIEIWVTSDGTEFTKIENGGFGNKENNWAYPYVFRDRLILGVSNGETGGEIWVSDDGQTFRQVVDGGLGDSGVTGFTGYADPDHPAPIFRDHLYIGVANPESGGEIWRTADGLAWERVADKGLTRSDSLVLSPDAVCQDRLYAFGIAGGTLDNLLGFDLFRSDDGVTWEQVVEDGFGVGEERNVSGNLQEFQGRLYLTTNNADPRLLMPDNPSERHPPHGFQLWVSDDGESWTQVGEDGFGAQNSFMAGMFAHGDTAYLSSVDYHEGSRLWRSSDGETWEMIFQEPEPNFFQEGAGPLDLKGHFLWFSNDLKYGVEMWRSDEVMVAESTTTTGGGGNGGTGGSDTTASDTGGTSGGADAGSGDDAGGAGGEGEVSAEAGGLSTGWVVLIVVLAAVAVAAIVAVAFLVGRTGRGPRAGSAASSGTAGQTSSQGASAPPAYCSDCGAPLSPGARFCPGCGKQL